MELEDMYIHNFDRYCQIARDQGGEEAWSYVFFKMSPE